jgi:hypothetical protein
MVIDIYVFVNNFNYNGYLYYIGIFTILFLEFIKIIFICDFFRKLDIINIILEICNTK